MPPAVKATPEEVVAELKERGLIKVSIPREGNVGINRNIEMLAQRAVLSVLTLDPVEFKDSEFSRRILQGQGRYATKTWWTRTGRRAKTRAQRRARRNNRSK